jgi:hypothetical protein
MCQPDALYQDTPVVCTLWYTTPDADTKPTIPITSVSLSDTSCIVLYSVYSTIQCVYYRETRTHRCEKPSARMTAPLLVPPPPLPHRSRARSGSSEILPVVLIHAVKGYSRTVRPLTRALSGGCRVNIAVLQRGGSTRPVHEQLRSPLAVCIHPPLCKIHTVYRIYGVSYREGCETPGRWSTRADYRERFAVR